MKTIFLLLFFSMLYLLVLLPVWYITGDEDIHYFNSYLSIIKLIDTGKTTLAKALLLPKFYLLTFFTFPIIIISYLSIKHEKFVEKNYYSSIPEKPLRFEEKDLSLWTIDDFMEDNILNNDPNNYLKR